MGLIYKTKRGGFYNNDSLALLKNKRFLEKHKQKVQLIFTSPPFPLVNKKNYGNLNGRNYIGIELEKDFVELSKKRINSVKQQKLNFD